MLAGGRAPIRKYGHVKKDAFVNQESKAPLIF